MANPKDKGTTIIIKKIQGGGGGAHGGAWKVAYADFVTAMMCFFLVMWLMGADEETKKEIAHYFNHPNTPYQKGRDPQSETVNPLGEKQGQGNNLMKGAEGAVPEDLVQKPLRDLKEDIEKKVGDITFGLELDTEFDELKFSMPGDELFEEGSTHIKKEAKKRLDQIAELFKKHQGQILIEGHLDKKPMISGDDPYLFSTARAVEIMNYFVKNHKMDSARFCPRGIGSNRAWRATASAGQDSRNRRVEFTVSEHNVCSE
ncbi:MAG: flagellar motor protein MotB [Bdellovibrionales bacterium]|nr:flagellar motor protein MotB [Bdellovibrionales bacterium]